jgi:2-oxoisovalerate dehydrogenase E1 component beta subunit
MFQWKSMAEIRMIEAVRAAIGEEMERDDRVLVMGEDVGRKGGVFGATDGLYARFGEARVLDTPLAESAIVGVAIGAALNGLIPIVEIQFADFIHPAFDQIVSEAARTRYRSNGDWSVPIVIRAPFGGGVHGGLYHSQSIEAFYAHVPGLKVVVPSMPADAHGLLKSAIRDPDPVLFLEHKKLYRLVTEEVPDGDHLVPLGPAIVRRPGTNLSCFAWGLMTHYCLEAAAQLETEGVSVEVVDLRTLAPLDRETILDSVRRTGKAMIVHEDNLTGGFGGEVAAIISEHAFGDLDGPVVRVAGPDIPAMPFNTPQEEFFMPNPQKIADAMRKLAAY